jgi:diguanylate cyclase (GGDEF)-like protein/PAS domain S-box-containing protein
LVLEEGFNQDFEFYFRLLKELTDGICITNANMKIIFWNESMVNNLSYSRAEAWGQPMLDLLQLRNAQNEENRFSEEDVRRIASENVVSDVFCRHREGHSVVMQVRINTYADPENQSSGFVLIFSDALVKTTIERGVKELEEIAYIDKLTELPNRRFLELEFEKHFSSYRRYHIPFGVLLLDIDHFKNVNDTYGHDNGDRVLKALGQKLLAVTRKDDVKTRWGGEEFVLLTRLSEPDKLIAFGERLRTIIEKTPVEIPDRGITINFTISVGVTLSRPEDDKNTLLKRCDEMLYKSKVEGRNRVSGVF